MFQFIPFFLLCLGTTEGKSASVPCPVPRVFFCKLNNPRSFNYSLYFRCYCPLINFVAHHWTQRSIVFISLALVSPSLDTTLTYDLLGLAEGKKHFPWPVFSVLPDASQETVDHILYKAVLCLIALTYVSVGKRIVKVKIILSCWFTQNTDVREMFSWVNGLEMQECSLQFARNLVNNKRA